MKKGTIKLKRGEVVGLHGLLESIGNVKHPFKMVTARNIKLLAGLKEEFMQAKEDIELEHIKHDQNGKQVLSASGLAKLKAADEKDPVLYSDLEYNTSNEAFSEAFKALNFEEIEVPIYQVSLAKKVTITGEKENREMTIEDVLEDEKLSELSANAIHILMDRVIVD